MAWQKDQPTSIVFKHTINADVYILNITLVNGTTVLTEEATLSKNGVILGKFTGYPSINFLQQVFVEVGAQL